jgi:surfeit locus 1 family protein
MRFFFRPLPAVTAATVAVLAVLLGLGTWQVQRLHWKLDLIAQVNRNLSLPPVALDAALKLGKAAEYHRVVLTGRFDHAKEAYVFGTVNGAPVYHVITPLLIDGRRVLLVDRGIVSSETRDPAMRRAGQVEGLTRVVGVWRTSGPPGFFTPAPELAHRIWYSRDVANIAAADHLALAAPVMVEADIAPNPGGWPQGGHTVVSFPNNHLQYAVTWYGLALTLLGVYIAFHVQKGRLKFR